MAIFKKIKNKEKLTSEDIKRILLNHYRYEKQYHYLCSECGKYNSDILLYNGNFLTEIEIKTDINDLKKDIKKKKHLIYNKDNKSFSNLFIPNRFYFAITSEIQDKAIEYIEDVDLFKKYGIIIVYQSGYVQFKKQAKLIHKEKPIKLMLDIIIKRMSSEICILYNKLKERNEYKRSIRRS